jgi:hypothetical protein
MCKKIKCKSLLIMLAMLIGSFGAMSQGFAETNVVAWGYNNYGQTGVPGDVTNATQAAGGDKKWRHAGRLGL